MQQQTNKTPVSMLHEICTRKNITPKYDLLQVEGAVHEPIFQYRLTVENNGRILEETGSGRSKKDAKHETALAMLKAMEIPELDVFSDRIVCVGNISVEQDEVQVEAELSGNPVGVLQELCMKMKLKPPSYNNHAESGLPHERIFSIACVVGENYKEIGTGKSKKLAKRKAAHMMADRLRSIPSETSLAHAFDDDDDKIIEALNEGKLTKDKISSKPIAPTKGDVEAIAKLCQKYNNLAKDIMSDLTADSVIEDPVKYLRNVGTKSGYDVFFIIVDELSTDKEPKHHHFVQITCDPPVIALGEGDTPEQAKLEASKKLIELFREFRFGCKLIDEDRESEDIDNRNNNKKDSKVVASVEITA